MVFGMRDYSQDEGLRLLLNQLFKGYLKLSIELQRYPKGSESVVNHCAHIKGIHRQRDFPRSCWSVPLRVTCLS